MAKYITITGCPGSGKTSLLNFIKSKFQCSSVFEKVESNPYVEQFYKNKSLWSLHLSTFYLLDAIDTIEFMNRTGNSANLICQDYEFRTHFEVYCKFLKSENYLSENDFQLCSKIHSIMLKDYSNPDLLIYLFSNPSTLISRLRSRNRLNESLSFNEEYLKKLSFFFEDWISKSVNKVCKIDTTELNLVSSNTDKNYIINLIQGVIKQ